MFDDVFIDSSNSVPEASLVLGKNVFCILCIMFGVIITHLCFLDLFY